MESRLEWQLISKMKDATSGLPTKGESDEKAGLFAPYKPGRAQT